VSVTRLCGLSRKMRIRWNLVEAVAEQCPAYQLAGFRVPVLKVMWMRGVGTKLHVLNSIQSRAAERDRRPVFEQTICTISNRWAQPLQIAARKHLLTASSMQSNELHRSLEAKLVVHEQWCQEARLNHAYAWWALTFHKLFLWDILRWETTSTMLWTSARQSALKELA